MTPEERAGKIMLVGMAKMDQPNARAKIAAAIREAVAEEREACAKAADVHFPHHVWYDDQRGAGNMARQIAATIRARP